MRYRVTEVYTMEKETEGCDAGAGDSVPENDLDGGDER